MTLQVWNQRLREAAAGWEEQGDDLYGAGRSVSAAQDDTGLLGARVGPVATSFLTTWGDVIESLRTEADRHSASLTTTAQEFLVSDQDTVGAMQRLLSWEDRTTRPVAPVDSRGMLR